MTQVLKVGDKVKLRPLYELEGLGLSAGGLDKLFGIGRIHTVHVVKEDRMGLLEYLDGARIVPSAWFVKVDIKFNTTKFKKLLEDL